MHQAVVPPSSARLTLLHPLPRHFHSYDADDEEEQGAALAAAAKGQQEGEKAAPAVVQAAAKAEPAAQKPAVIAEAKKQEEEQQMAAKEAAAEAEEEAKQAARSGVVLGAAATPAAKKAQPEIKISPQVGGWVLEARSQKRHAVVVWRHVWLLCLLGLRATQIRTQPHTPLPCNSPRCRRRLRWAA